MRKVHLNQDDKDLDFIITNEGNGGRSLEGFMWSGCRANYGSSTGRVAFGIRIDNGQLCRVGVGTAAASLQLGQCDQSFGYGGTGKKSNNNVFTDYGQRFGRGDTVLCLLDFEGGTISFEKNGVPLGEAFRIPNWLRSVPLYPQVLTKNADFTMIFEDGYGAPALPHGFQWIANHHELVPSTWGNTRSDALQSGDPIQEKEELPMGFPQAVPYGAGPDILGGGPHQRRLIMLVGLPGSGKTFWARKYVQDHPQMKFQLLSTNLIMERLMPSTRHTYTDRFQKLIGEATDILNEQLRIASKEQGNIIWDQTNVYPNARRRKLADFRNFRKTAIVFLPDPLSHAQWIQNQKEETGQQVPESTMREFKANFVLPEVGDAAGFHEVVYAFQNSPSEQLMIMERYKREAAGMEPVAVPSRKRQRTDDECDEPPLKVQKREETFRGTGKSYGERQFTSSNPYRPDLPYDDQLRRAPPEQRQAALQRQVVVEEFARGQPHSQSYQQQVQYAHQPHSQAYQQHAQPYQHSQGQQYPLQPFHPQQQPIHQHQFQAPQWQTRNPTDYNQQYQYPYAR